MYVASDQLHELKSLNFGMDFARATKGILSAKRRVEVTAGVSAPLRFFFLLRYIVWFPAPGHVGGAAARLALAQLSFGHKPRPPA